MIIDYLRSFEPSIRSSHTVQARYATPPPPPPPSAIRATTSRPLAGRATSHLLKIYMADPRADGSPLWQFGRRHQIAVTAFGLNGYDTQSTHAVKAEHGTPSRPIYQMPSFSSQIHRGDESSDSHVTAQPLVRNESTPCIFTYPEAFIFHLLQVDYLCFLLRLRFWFLLPQAVPNLSLQT